MEPVADDHGCILPDFLNVVKYNFARKEYVDRMKEGQNDIFYITGQVEC